LGAGRGQHGEGRDNQNKPEKVECTLQLPNGGPRPSPWLPQVGWGGASTGAWTEEQAAARLAQVGGQHPGKRKSRPRPPTARMSLGGFGNQEEACVA